MRRCLLFVAAAITLLAACGGDDDSAQHKPEPITTSTTESPTTTAPVTVEPTTTTTAPPSTTATTVVPSTTSPTTPPPAAPAGPPGSTGPEVAALQRRLQSLHYWVGTPDGHYGLVTRQAVYAFQKVNGLTVDGVAGPATRARLDHPVAPHPQSHAGLVWEVDKTRQVLMVVRDGQVVWIWNTSTGTEKPYTHKGVHHMADTPVGHYTFTRQIDGWRNGPLGLLYRPKYWHPDGLAIHGYSNVPPYPASHGCVRVINPAMDAIWSSGLAPVGTPIWIYGHSPGT